MQFDFEYTRNHKYVDHRVIMADLMSMFKQKTFSEIDIINWCQAVENRDIGDVDNMVRYIKVPLQVDKFTTVDLPCNIYRVLDVFDSRDRRIPFTTNKNGSKLVVNKDLKLTGVFINYIGNPIDSQGTPLIVRGHENACLYKCITNAFMEDFALGNITANAYLLFEEKATNYIREARGTLRHKSMADWDNLNTIQGNIVPKIGRLSLFHKLYE